MDRAQRQGSLNKGPELLTVQQFWRRLTEETGIALSRASIYRRINYGLVKSLRWGGKIFIPKTELETIKKQLFNGITNEGRTAGAGKL